MSWPSELAGHERTEICSIIAGEGILFSMIIPWFPVMISMDMQGPQGSFSSSDETRKQSGTFRVE